ncbi:hypothetical protein SCAR479_07707 [Seiridium cardinale]|uniref:Uncharacterized protein n=1 Tax=Seiridium cardinale TaxID=138064 RepID=A0ABR2XPR2_9PEZI
MANQNLYPQNITAHLQIIHPVSQSNQPTGIVPAREKKMSSLWRGCAEKKLSKFYDDNPTERNALPPNYTRADKEQHYYSVLAGNRRERQKERKRLRQAEKEASRENGISEELQVSNGYSQRGRSPSLEPDNPGLGPFSDEEKKTGQARDVTFSQGEFHPDQNVVSMVLAPSKLDVAGKGISLEHIHDVDFKIDTSLDFHNFSN